MQRFGLAFAKDLRTISVEKLDLPSQLVCFYRCLVGHALDLGDQDVVKRVQALLQDRQLSKPKLSERIQVPRRSVTAARSLRALSIRRQSASFHLL